MFEKLKRAHDIFKATLVGKTGQNDHPNRLHRAAYSLQHLLPTNVRQAFKRRSARRPRRLQE